MNGRIFFPGNPWPEGHALAALVWTARLEITGGLRFDLHLESADYYAEDPAYWDDDEDEDDGPAWESKIVWGNYHSCTLSSTMWGHSGFPAGALALASLSGREFHVDRDPERPGALAEGAVAEHSDFAFGVYLLGHDSVADHRIRFGDRHDATTFDLDWRGRIALTYVNAEAPFRHEFRVTAQRVPLVAITVPDDLDDTSARRLLSGALMEADDLILSTVDGQRAFTHRPGG